jgi:hypothetical protein
MKNRILENFNEFLMAAEIYQRPDATKRYEFGSNPSLMDLPFNFERSPEIGEDSNLIKLTLERIQSLSNEAINKISDYNEDEIDSYVKSEFIEAYKHFREAYLRLMDMKKK